MELKERLTAAHGSRASQERRGCSPRASEASLLLTAMCSARLLSLNSIVVKVLFADCFWVLLSFVLERAVATLNLCSLTLEGCFIPNVQH